MQRAIHTAPFNAVVLDRKTGTKEDEGGEQECLKDFLSKRFRGGLLQRNRGYVLFIAYNRNLVAMRRAWPGTLVV